MGIKEDFLKAAHACNLEEVKKLHIELQRLKIHPNTIRDAKKNTALHLAVYGGNIYLGKEIAEDSRKDIQVVNYLLEHCDIELEASGDNNKTPFLVAAEQCNLVMLQHLNLKRAKIGVKDASSNNAVELANKSFRDKTIKTKVVEWLTLASQPAVPTEISPASVNSAKPDIRANFIATSAQPTEVIAEPAITPAPTQTIQPAVAVDKDNFIQVLEKNQIKKNLWDEILFGLQYLLQEKKLHLSPSQYERFYTLYQEIILTKQYCELTDANDETLKISVRLIRTLNESYPIECLNSFEWKHCVHELEKYIERLLELMYALKKPVEYLVNQNLEELERLSAGFDEIHSINFNRDLWYEQLGKCINTVFSLPFNKDKIIKLLSIWARNIFMMDESTWLASTGKIIFKIAQYQPQLEDLIVFLVREVYQRFIREDGIFGLLRAILNYENVKNFFANTDSTNNTILELINNDAFALGASELKYQFFSEFLFYVVSHNRARLSQLLSGINFYIHNSYMLPKSIFAVFILQSNDMQSKHVFIEALVDSKQLDYFYKPEIIAGQDKAVMSILDNLLKSDYSDHIVTDIISTDKNISVYSFMTPIFLYCSRQPFYGHDPIIWYRLLYYMGKNIHFIEQYEIIDEHKENPENDDWIFSELHIALNNFYNYTHGNPENQACYQRLYDLFVERVIKALAEGGMVNIKIVIKSIQRACEHLIGVDKTYLDWLFSIHGKIGEYESGINAVLDIYSNALKSKDIAEWNTQELAERILFIYCYTKYPIEEYEKWFREANIDNLTQEEMDELFENFDDKKKSIAGIVHLPKFGFKFLQHSQVIAILASLSALNESGRYFSRIGTGQGKSVTIALTALAHALKNNHVFIFTVYRHLANRDYNRFKALYAEYNIGTQLIENQSSFSENRSKIIYGEIITFFCSFYSIIQKRAKNEPISAEEANIFDPNTVIILDEFDSILYGDCAINYSYIMHEFMDMPSIKKEDLEDETSLKNVLIVRPWLKSFFDALDKCNLGSLYRSWFNQYRDSWAPGKQNQTDALGKSISYLGGKFGSLIGGGFYTRAMFLDVLAYVKQAKVVIGVSGSITKERLQRTSQIFPEKRYIDVPPFFGPKKNKNRTIAHSCIQDNEQWLAAVKKDIERAISANQPILVFADYTKAKENSSDWEQIKTLLKSCCEKYGLEFNEIISEEQITNQVVEKVCKNNSVTLASHVFGRGVDCVMQPDVMRYCMQMGMHVTVSYYPSYKMNGKKYKDNRMLEQMIGRTARLDNNGSHSIITKKENTLLDEPTSPIPLEEYTEQFHNLSAAIYNKIKYLPYNKELWQKWFLLQDFFATSKEYPNQFREMGNYDNVANWVILNILQSIQPEPVTVPIVEPSEVEEVASQEEEELQEQQQEQNKLPSYLPGSIRHGMFEPPATHVSQGTQVANEALDKHKKCVIL